MDITANGIRTINDEKQVTYFTLTSGIDVYKWHANTPTYSGTELQNYLDSQIESYHDGIMYKVNNGTFQDTHPDIMPDKDVPLNRGKISSSTINMIQTAASVDDLKEVLLRIFVG